MWYDNHIKRVAKDYFYANSKTDERKCLPIRPTWPSAQVVDMKINIIARKVTLRDHFKDLVTKKLGKFDRIFDEDAEATVTVTVEKKFQTVEISIKQRGMIYRAESSELEMNDALDKVITALSAQMRKNKTKLQRAKKVQEDVDFSGFDFIDEEIADEEDQVAKTKRFFVSVMTPQEAILQMNMLDHEFFLFRDDASGDVNVVYKRKNGDYGLLIPEGK